MAEAMRGLRVRPQHEELIGVAKSGALENTKSPNRNSKFLRDGFILSQLDREGTRQMQLQQEQASKQAFKESLLKQIAINIGSNLSDLRNQSEADSRTERVNQATNPNTQFHSISRSDHEMESYYSLPPSNETEMGDDISRSLSPLSSISPMSVTQNQNVAVADNSGEVEGQRQIA